MNENYIFHIVENYGNVVPSYNKIYYYVKDTS